MTIIKKGSSVPVSDHEFPEYGLDQEIAFIEGLCDEFKAFVKDAMEEGHHNEFDDHLGFLGFCMMVFRDSKENKDYPDDSLQGDDN